MEANELRLTDNHGPLVALVLPSNSSENEKLAANELSDHIELITGYKILRDTHPKEGVRQIRLGNSIAPLAARLLDKEEVGPDAFALYVDKNGIQIAGGSDSGTLIGTYELLEQLGIRWFLPGEAGTVFQPKSTLAIPWQETVQVPSFRARHLQGGLGLDKKDWSSWLRRNRCGGERFPSAHGMKLPKDVLDKNTEILAIVNGKRRKPQLCLSSPKTLEVVADQVKLFFARNPSEPWIGLGPADGDGDCECPGCTALDAGIWDPYKGGVSHTDRYIWFFNKLLDRISPELPDKKIAFYAYDNCMLPPQTIKPSDRIVPALAPINLCRIHGPGNPNCPEQQAYISIAASWRSLVPKVYDRGYWSNLADPGLMFPMYDKIQRQVLIDHQLGIEGFRIECFHHWASEGPSLYLAMRLMWDHTSDPQMILDDYFRQYYGPASQDAKNFYLEFHSALSKAELHAGGAWDFPLIYSVEVRQGARHHLEQAKTKAVTQPWQSRIQELDLAFLYTETFLNMIDDRTNHRHSAAYLKYAELERIQQVLTKRSLPLLNARHAPAYLERFYGRSIKSAHEALASNGDDVIALLQDQWRFETIPSYEVSLPVIRASQSWSAQGLRNFRGQGIYFQTFELKTLPAFASDIWLAGVDESVKIRINGIETVPYEPVTPFQAVKADVTKLLRVGTNTVELEVTNVKLNELGTGGLLGPVFIARNPKL